MVIVARSILRSARVLSDQRSTLLQIYDTMPVTLRMIFSEVYERQ